jgi:hypothetical protein
MNLPPTFGSITLSSCAISLDGVIGYPPKKLHPQSIAACAHNSLPFETIILDILRTNFIEFIAFDSFGS